jgi:arabinofuranosyltransferase
MSRARAGSREAGPAIVPPPPPSGGAPRAPRWLPLAVAALGLAVPLVMLALARAPGWAISFPVDDAWIHLTFARNLARFGDWSYFPGDPVTAGSTSPLFTLLEAVGFRFTANENLVGIGLGLAAHALFLFALARWALRRLAHPGWAALVVALVAADGRFGILAVSGMETSLFLAFVALAFAAWVEDDALGAGLALGAATWTRPEALIVAGVFALDSLAGWRRPRRLLPGLAAFVAIVLAYLVFNRLTGPAFLPNTMASKIAFHRGLTLARFFARDLGPTFGGGWLLLLPLALVGAWGEVRRLRTRERGGARAELGWAIALPLAYAIVLRISHRFNRYLVPALPAYAIVAVVGLRALLERWTPARARAGAWTAAGCGLLIAVQAFHFAPTFTEYRVFARYHLERHVRAGRWLAAHTPEDAVVATHDIGAIAFYSQRRIVDMVGLVTPEVTPHLLQPDYIPFLERLFAARRVTHLAVLQEWQGVDNQAPLFEADPDPEVLDVYAWRPGVTHMVTTAVSGSERLALAALESGHYAEAMAQVRALLGADDRAATVWTLYGAVLDRSGHPAEAEPAFRRALALFPGSAEARFGLGVALANLGRAAEAGAQLDSLRTIDPGHPGIAWLERRLGSTPGPGRPGRAP